MNYWIVVTSKDNFNHDRENLQFRYQGLPHRFRKQVQKMKEGDRVVYYIMKIQKFGASIFREALKTYLKKTLD